MPRTNSRLVTIFAVAAGATLAAVAAPAAAAPGFLESHAHDPVSATPAVSRPHTRHCTVTLAHDFASNAPDESRSGSAERSPRRRAAGAVAKVVIDYRPR